MWLAQVSQRPKTRILGVFSLTRQQFVPNSHYPVFFFFFLYQEMRIAQFVVMGIFDQLVVPIHLPNMCFLPGLMHTHSRPQKLDGNAGRSVRDIKEESSHTQKQVISPFDIEVSNIWRSRLGRLDQLG